MGSRTVVTLLGDCFRDFRVSARRLESLPSYSEPEEDEQLRAWREGQPRPERSVRTDSYLRKVAADVLAGRERKRVRIADHPPGEYLRWELAGYVENAAAGEETLVAVRRDGSGLLVPDLAGVAADFVWFDAGTRDECAVLLEYNLAGAFTGERPATAQELGYCRHLWHVAEEHSVPLAAYLASAREAAAAA
jgi:hypothetical protein